MSDVTVIIPAYNAAATIDETLWSVRRQSHKALEIIVIDDGSSDDTAAHVQSHVTADPRIRLLQQDNAGVAAARNTGIAQATTRLIAPIDADDLWMPTKIEKQLAAMTRGGAETGLVYSWFSVIDDKARVLNATNSSSEEGDVLRRLCMGNLVGNGSSPLMRLEAVERAGGYDPGLRAQSAQGCEDLKLYFSIAEQYRYALVREHLTGYRVTSDNMSSDGRRMLKSYDLVMEPKRALYPQYAAEFAYGRAFISEWLFYRAFRYGTAECAMALLRDLSRVAPRRALRVTARLPVSFLKRQLRIGFAGRAPFLPDTQA